MPRLLARLALLLVFLSATARAGSHNKSGSSHGSTPRHTPTHHPAPKHDSHERADTKPQPDHKPDQPSRADTKPQSEEPRFEHKVVKPGLERIDIPGAPKDQGYVLYEHDPRSGSTKIVYVAGIKGQPGMGEALKREVLRRHPSKEVHSMLVEVNHKKLLAVWAREGRRPTAEELRREVPALRVEGYHYEIVPNAHTGDIDLVMTPTPGSTTVTVRDEAALDAIVHSEGH